MAKGEPPRRTDRLAAALRENLRRRKAQARGRASSTPAPAPDEAASPAARGTLAEPGEPGEDE